MGLLAVALAASPAAAAAHVHTGARDTGIEDYLLYSGENTVTTSTGAKLNLETDFVSNLDGHTCEPGDGGSNLFVYASSASKRVAQAFRWVFNVECSDFTTSGDNATATLTDGELGDFGSMTLTFTGSGPAKTLCSGTNQQPGSESESLDFDTQGTWGTIDTTINASSPTFGTDTENEKYRCKGRPERHPVPRCLSPSTPSYRVEWEGFNSDNHPLPTFADTTGRKRQELVGSLPETDLDASTDGTVDGTIAVSDPPTISAHGNHRTVRIKGSGGSSTGSLTLKTAGRESQSQVKCRLGHKHTMMVERVWTKGTLTNGPQRFTLHTSVGVPISFPDASAKLYVAEDSR